MRTESKVQGLFWTLSPRDLFLLPPQLRYLHEETSASLPASLYSSTGQGCISFRLLNLRDAYSFALMRGNVTSPLLLATSTAVGFKEPNEVGREGGGEEGRENGRTEERKGKHHRNSLFPFLPTTPTHR